MTLLTAAPLGILGYFLSLVPGKLSHPCAFSSYKSTPVTLHILLQSGALESTFICIGMEKSSMNILQNFSNSRPAKEGNPSIVKSPRVYQHYKKTPFYLFSDCGE